MEEPSTNLVEALGQATWYVAVLDLVMGWTVPCIIHLFNGAALLQMCGSGRPLLAMYHWCFMMLVLCARD